MSSLIDKKVFKLTILWLILAEILSFFGWLLPSFNTVCFFVILFLILILSLQKLEYGILILLAESFVGSKGYLFSLEYGQTLVSIRIGLFLVVMGVWIYKWVGSKLHLEPQGNLAPGTTWSQRGASALRKWYLALGVVVMWGLVWGLIRGNDFGNVFLDFNGWLYFLLIFPWLSVAFRPPGVPSLLKGGLRRGNPSFITNVLSVLTACITWLGIKTLILLYIFSHQFIWALPEVYNWVRDTRVGEVTMMSGNFYRIFFQSQIYSLIGFFIVLIILIFRRINRFPAMFHDVQENRSQRLHRINGNISNKKITLCYWLLVILTSTTLIVSFSRSFWLGLLAGLAFFYGLLKFKFKYSWPQVFKWIGVVFLVFTLSIGIIFALINLPPVKKGDSFASLIEKRVIEIEAAGSARINLLGPLFKKIVKHPIIGSGFGTEVSYRSTDPRIIAETAGRTGIYTTYAFEWGYLDLLLKVGLIGVMVYLSLIGKIFSLGWQQIKYQISQLEADPPRPENIKYQIENASLSLVTCHLSLGLLLGLVALVVTNITSPYLNHPLGIGYIMLTSVFLETFSIGSAE